MCVRAVELDEFDARNDKVGFARVGSAMRAAVQRNQLVGRRMRLPMPPLEYIDSQTAAALRNAAVCMLNADLCFLVACSVVCQTAAGRRFSPPPTFERWREEFMIYGTSLLRVKTLYDAYALPNQPLIEHVNGNERVLKKTREQACAVVRSFV